MKKFAFLTAALFAISHSVTLAQDSGVPKKCYELCVHGEWILDFDGSSYNAGDTLVLNFEIGGVFKYNFDGLNQEFTVTDTFTNSYVLADIGHNSEFGVDDSTPDGRVDPLWIMGAFSACETVELPSYATLVDTWKFGTITATVNGNPVAGPAFSFGTNIDANHVYQNGPVFSSTEVNCVPETSSSLLAALGALLLVRRRR